MILELFCCSGGLAEGFRRAGVPVNMAVDNNPDACDSYEYNLGHRPLQMNARDLLRLVEAGWRPAETIELLLADPPCTPWSRAGKRLGLADDRDMLGVTCKLIELLHPPCWLIANVPGLEDGDHWRSVVQPLIGGLAQRGGWCCDYARLDAADYGVPQHRRRPFWFAHPAGTPGIQWPSPTHCAPARASHPHIPGVAPLLPWVTCRDALQHLPLEELGRPVRLRWGDDTGGRETLRGNAKHQPARPDSPCHCIRAGSEYSAPQLVLARPSQGQRVGDPDSPGAVIVAQPSKIGAGAGLTLEWPWDRAATTIQADERMSAPGHHGPESNQHGPNAIILSEQAAAILQGFPDNWIFSGKTKKSRWSQLGQAMPPPLAEAIARAYARWRRDYEAIQ